MFFKEDNDGVRDLGKEEGVMEEFDEWVEGFLEREGRKVKADLKISNYVSSPDSEVPSDAPVDPFEQLDTVTFSGEGSFLSDNYDSKTQEALSILEDELHKIDTPTMGVKESMEDHVKRFGRSKTESDEIYDAYVEKLIGERMEEMEYDKDGIDEEDEVLTELIGRRADYGKEAGWAVPDSSKVTLADDDGERENGFDSSNLNTFNPEPLGDWAETIVKVDRTQKVTKGGTIMTHRCLMICGNGKGAGGFGVGKGQSPKEAMLLASRNSRKNLTLIDRYDDSALTHDCVGEHNGCKVVIRAVPPGRGMKGSSLTSEILYQCGVSDASVKSYGNRNPYSVVMATFKALRNHEGIESVARKRGKRIMSLTKAFKLGLS
ncbi:hypothetical protein TrST_g1572 [Triparma strigata]|uniref:S5 DRBM domain-containing protein n=2 Tax=Triparma TaxID=722752 RepID=A0A9W7BYL7_9STRA|nr:hypothetical protein TrST_g1572 [Triparma strigata]